MALVLVTTPGALNANSYETVAEADAYFDGRLPLAPPWEDAESPEAALVMATRVLDAMAQPHRTLKVDACQCQYYLTARQWTGAPATTTQRLAWPRVGMKDRNGNSLDFSILSISVANPTVITTDRPHGRVTGETVFLYGSNSTPVVDGAYAVTVISSTTFSIILNVTVAGTSGTMTFIPQDLKDALSELAGQLLRVDSTLDNDVMIQGVSSIKAGSVAITFKDNIAAHVLPTTVINLLPSSWFTSEVIEYTQQAEFDVI